MDYSEFGKRIFRLRNEYKMTQRQLADELFVIDKTISRWECGHGFPEVTTIARICEIFDIPFKLLMDETNNLSDPNVSLEELKKKYLDTEDTKDEPKKEKKKPKLSLILGASGVAIIIAIAISLSILLNMNKKTINNTIAHYSWEVVKNSKADFVFFTSFGKEETMSLELTGDLRSGTFTCVETWVENERNSILDCQVGGTYSITSESKINFVSKYRIDPNDTKKIYTNAAVGVDYFTANVITSYINEEVALSNDSFLGISFMTTEAKTSTSVFGRWTKFRNYFSRVAGEILFQRIENNNFSLNQLARSPNMMLDDLKVIVPKEIVVFSNPNKTVYIEREYFKRDGMEIALIYNDGSTFNVTSQVKIKNEDVPLSTSDSSVIVIYDIDELYLSTRIYIKVFSLD